MKMTTRGRYGLRAMLELARRHGEGPVQMTDLARRERLSRKYLHTLLAALKSAGLVRSTRGVAGGFELSRKPGEIRLSEILHAVEGPLALVDCVRRPKACDRAAHCTARRVWLGLSDAIEGLLSGITLSNLLTLEAPAPALRARSTRNLLKAPVSGRCARRCRLTNPKTTRGGRK